MTFNSLYDIIKPSKRHQKELTEVKIMEAILEFVQKLLTFLREFEAAGIIEIIKEFFAGLAK